METYPSGRKDGSSVVGVVVANPLNVQSHLHINNDIVAGSPQSVGTNKKIGLGIGKRPGDNLLASYSNFGAAVNDSDKVPGYLNRFSMGSIDSDGMDQSVISSIDGSSYIEGAANDTSIHEDQRNNLNKHIATLRNGSPVHNESAGARLKYYFQGKNGKTKSQTSLPMNTETYKNKSASHSSVLLPKHLTKDIPSHKEHNLYNHHSNNNIGPQLDHNHHAAARNKNIQGVSRTNVFSQSSPSLPIPQQKSENPNVFLTPSQKYRSHKNNASLRKTIRRKEKYYDQQDVENSMELEDEFVNDSVIWNIPMASYSTSSFLDTQIATEKKHYKAGHKTINSEFQPPLNHNGMYQKNSVSSPQLPILDYTNMPMSPIPGINYKSDLEFIKETTQSLSAVYLNSSNRLSKTKLMERTESAETLPIELKDASNNGMEDLLLISEDKLSMVSHSRPSWLPPKDSDERKKHEAEISKTMSIASIDQLDRNKDTDERLLKNETNWAKYTLLVESGITRNSSIKTFKQQIWETPLNTELRYRVYDESLQSDIRFITGRFIEPFPQMMQLLNTMSFPGNKEMEIEKLIDSSIRNKISGNGNISEHLPLMLQLKSISQQGLIPGDELLFHHLLLEFSETESLEKVWDMVSLIQLTCFNDLTKEKYDFKITEPKGIVDQHIGNDESYANEYNQNMLNFSTWWNILERLNHNLFMWTLDIIVIRNIQSFKNYPIKMEEFSNRSWDYYKNKRLIVNYKILLSFALNVLINYHFQFNDLKSLALLEDKSFCIPMPLDDLVDEFFVNSVFIKKWSQYYKKF